MTQFLAVLLIIFGGFLIGGVLSFRKTSVPIAVLFAIGSLGCVVGGVLWLIG